MRRAPADALRAVAEMVIAGSPPRLSTHPDRFLAALHPPSRSALTSNPHSARCPAGAQLPATSCLGAFWTPVSCGCLDPRYCRRPKTCTKPAVPSTTEHSRSTFNCGRTVTLPSRREVAEPHNWKLEAVDRRRIETP